MKNFILVSPCSWSTNSQSDLSPAHGIVYKPFEFLPFPCLVYFSRTIPNLSILLKTWPHPYTSHLYKLFWVNFHHVQIYPYTHSPVIPLLYTKKTEVPSLFKSVLLQAPCSLSYWATQSFSHSYVSPNRFLKFPPLVCEVLSYQRIKNPFSLCVLLSLLCCSFLLCPRIVSSMLRISSTCLRLKSSNFKCPGQMVPWSFNVQLSACHITDNFIHSFIQQITCCMSTWSQEWLNNRMEVEYE